MRQMRADAAIELTVEERAALEKVMRARRTPQAVAQRARIVLLTADGFAPTTIGEQLGMSQPTIRKWRARYAQDGLSGLRSEPRPVGIARRPPKPWWRPRNVVESAYVSLVSARTGTF